MKILVFTPAHPHYGVRPETDKSITNLDYDGPIYKLTKWDKSNIPSWEKGALNKNITHNYNVARDIVLESDYDAMLTVEADMVLETTALGQLVDAMQSTAADVVYALYVFRQREELNLCTALTQYARTKADREYIAENDGRIVDCVGLGLGCTLIHRRVLEAFPFRLYDEAPGMLSCDWRFSIDCQEHGFKQVMHLGVHCGHITHDGRTLWPHDYIKETNYVA